MKHEMGSVIGNINSFFRATESGKPKNIPRKASTAVKETAANVDIVLGYMGVSEAITTEAIRLQYPDARVIRGYVREDGRVLPAAVIRWDNETRSYPFGKKTVSSAVKIVCHTQEDFVEIHYSSDEKESRSGRERVGWKQHGMNLPGYHEEGRDPAENYIAIEVLKAMERANGKMFDDSVESSGSLNGRRRII